MTTRPPVDLYIDTRSNSTLLSCGAAAYAQDPSTQVERVTYDFGDHTITWTPGEARPTKLLQHLSREGRVRVWDADYTIWIWQERLRQIFDVTLYPHQVLDLSHQARVYTLPSAFEDAVSALGLEVSGNCTIGLQKRIAAQVPPISVREREIGQLTHRINARGIRVDEQLLTRFVTIARQNLSIAGTDKRILNLLEATQRHLSSGGRVRDYLICAGSQTLRWAPWGPRPSGLPKIVWSAAEVLDALEFMRTAKYPAIEERYGDPLNALTHCLRALYIPAPGKKFVTSDLRAFEPTILAHLSGEEWMLEGLKFGCLYESAGSALTGVPLLGILECQKTTGQPHAARELGKKVHLSCQYGGGLKALEKFGALGHMTPAEGATIVAKWREKSPRIVALWRSLEKAAIQAVEEPGKIYGSSGIDFRCKGTVLSVRIRNRCIRYYQHPEIRNGVLTYLARGAQSRWVRRAAHGAKLVNHVTQGLGREIFAKIAMRLEYSGMHVVDLSHDSIVCELPESESPDTVTELSEQPPQGWETLSFHVHTYSGQRYGLNA